MSKLNLVKPQGVVIEMKGVEYDLVYDFNAFAELEKAFGDIQTAFDKLSRQGISQLVECRDAGVTSVEVKVFQKNLNGEQQLGTISIPNPGGKEYEIFMNIDAKTGMLVVTLYDVKHRRWIDEIPLSQRQYIVK